MKKGVEHFLKFVLRDDDTYVVYGRKNEDGTYGEIENIDIPESYKGKPVTALGYGAFYNCTSLKSINIPDSVTYIDNSVFAGCKNLVKITIYRYIMLGLQK